MKGTLEDGTLVDIEKPGPIEQDGKWWEFTVFRPAKNKENTLDHSWDDEGCNGLVRPVVKDTARPYWIASEIPRATASQLRAIGMKERDGRPVICKGGNRVWDFGVHDELSFVGKYRFVLEPDVHGETSERKSKDILDRLRSYNPLRMEMQTDLHDAICEIEMLRSYNQPPRPEELRFSVGEIKAWIDDYTMKYISHGIKAFTEKEAR
jgi:hypothetical protein